MASGDDPFAQNTPSGDDDRNPLADFMAQFGITPGPDGDFDMAQMMDHLQQAMNQFNAHLSQFGGTDGGMNWTFTKDIARKLTAAQGADPSPDSIDVKDVRDAVNLAELWLDGHTVFGRLTTPAAAWSRAEWVENTFDVWRQLVNPVTTSLANAITGLLNQQTDAEMVPMASMMEPMMRTASAGMLSSQIGQALSNLATAVVSVSDISIPLTRTPQVALLPTNVKTFADGLDQELSDVRLYLALREAARQRLFADVAWLGPQLLAMVEHYARDIAIDASAIEQTMESQFQSQLSAEDLETLGNSVAGQFFTPTLTDEQKEVLARLETLLALVEGWVDDVVSTTTATLMPGAQALLETVRRRRAAGGPAETALKSLLNLELRPRRVRDAANVWAAVRSARGYEARDALWAHPDLIPTAENLNDPLGFVEHGRAGDHANADFDDMDAQLARLLEEEGRSPEA